MRIACSSGSLQQLSLKGLWCSMYHTRDYALLRLVKLKNDVDAISVVTMTAVPLWHRLGGAKRLHLDAACMGQAAPLALGIALARPDKIVIAVDGDGSLLMELGMMAVVGREFPDNFHHFLFVNHRYESTGGQPVAEVDWSRLAMATGYNQVYASIPPHLGFDGPGFYPLEIGAEAPEEWPSVDLADSAAKLMKELSSDISTFSNKNS